jgi:hypothetical protein
MAHAGIHQSTLHGVVFDIFCLKAGTGSSFAVAKASCCFDRQQLCQRADDAIGFYLRFRRQAFAMP